MRAFPDESCRSRFDALVVIEAVPLCAFGSREGCCSASAGYRGGCDACVLGDGLLPARRVVALPCADAAALVEGGVPW